VLTNPVLDPFGSPEFNCAVKVTPGATMPGRLSFGGTACSRPSQERRGAPGGDRVAAGGTSWARLSEAIQLVLRAAQGRGSSRATAVSAARQARPEDTASYLVSRGATE
jgi:hypothetical protein